MDGIGCRDSVDAVACLREKDASELKDYVERNMLVFAPVVDNITVVSDAEERRLAGNIAQVPIMAGTTAEEGRVFFPAADGSPTLDQFLNFAFPNLPDVHAAIREFYPLGSLRLETDTDIIAAIYTDIAFNCVSSFALLSHPRLTALAQQGSNRRQRPYRQDMAVSLQRDLS